MTVNTPAGPLVLAASIRELSAARYLCFNQAWAREAGLGPDVYAADSHLARLGMFLSQNETAAARTELNNLMLGLLHLQQGPEAVPLLAAVLAPLVVSIAGQSVPAEVTETALSATAAAVLATGITEEGLRNAVDQSKKKTSLGFSASLSRAVRPAGA